MHFYTKWNVNLQELLHNRAYTLSSTPSQSGMDTCKLFYTKRHENASSSTQTGRHTCKHFCSNWHVQVKHFYTNWHIHVQALLHKLVCRIHVQALLRKLACTPASTSTQTGMYICKHFNTNWHVQLQILQHKLSCTSASIYKQIGMYILHLKPLQDILGCALAGTPIQTCMSYTYKHTKYT
jgi:hypothetical protein